MNDQIVINVLIGVVLAAGSWWLKVIWETLRSQQEQISSLNIKLAENYATRTETNGTLARIFDALDDIKKEVTHVSRNQASVKTLREMLGRDRHGTDR